FLIGSFGRIPAGSWLRLQILPRVKPGVAGFRLRHLRSCWYLRKLLVDRMDRIGSSRSIRLDLWPITWHLERSLIGNSNVILWPCASAPGIAAKSPERSEDLQR